ncbi:helix-turn-helix transcriptional regulator [Salipiger sp. PrR002]|uniref:AraC family transcriptional regulator n=1 Tax=Salipiger sp. PrR002 TaxID=2706489 RepID=UPI0013BB0A62|nr:helix-turn-helix transcriptional regulator [Salipiger sp. PrR002]NDW00208.1 AraC family transcriptional regulator [Salipiger sp. PrR002]NDW56783.1 AraC family transcriptional regulator [Salipiger sp. PrR004]
MRQTAVESVTVGGAAVIATANEYPAHLEFPEHRHARAQLLYASRGVVTVNTPAGSWVMPPQRAVWLPPDTPHSARTNGRVSMRSIYIAPELAATLDHPGTCCVVEVSELLRALLRASADMPLTYPEHSRYGRIAQLMLDELNFNQITPLNAPLPQHPKLRAICADIMRRPGQRVSIDDVADRMGVSRSSLTRLFRTETGLSFGIWLQQARMLEALRNIADGQPLAHVALDCGFANQSAFTTCFRKILGMPPSQYFASTLES